MTQFEYEEYEIAFFSYLLTINLYTHTYIHTYIYIYIYIEREREREVGSSYTWCNFTRVTLFFFFNHRLALDLMVNNILCLVISILNIALLSYQKPPFYFIN